MTDAQALGQLLEVMEEMNDQGALNARESQALPVLRSLYTRLATGESVVVPLEPTFSMQRAGQHTLTIAGCWRAMIDEWQRHDRGLEWAA